MGPHWAPVLVHLFTLLYHKAVTPYQDPGHASSWGEIGNKMLGMELEGKHPHGNMPEGDESCNDSLHWGHWTLGLLLGWGHGKAGPSHLARWAAF